MYLESMMDDFVNDFMDGKVTAQEYPESYKYMEALTSKATKLELDSATGDLPTVLDSLSKLTAFLSELSKATLENDPTKLGEAFSNFTGVSLDMDKMREEVKEYMKAKIDEL